MKKTILLGLVLLLTISMVSAIDPINITTHGSSEVTSDSADVTGLLSNLMAPEADENESVEYYKEKETGPGSIGMKYEKK